MFKNARLYKLPAGWTIDLDAMAEHLSRNPFQPCGPTDQQSSGWLSSRGEANGALVEYVAGQRILKFAIESKAVPASAVKRKLDERIAQIEQQEGRKPGRKAQRELKEEIVRELLPAAFPKTSEALVWFDLQKGRVMLDCSTQASADLVITALVQALPGLVLSPLNTELSPQLAMTNWLTGDADSWPEGFAPGREVELKATDELKSRVKFDHHHLDDEQMRLHIAQGKLPTKLALDWDGRVSFVLTEGGLLKKIAFLDGVFADGHEGGFDADIAIATGELSALIDGLVEALGGEMGLEGGAV